jgi:folylpolyglutamate synthase/dihydropteroate synthase
MKPEDIKTELKEFRDDFIITRNVKSALETAKSIASPSDLICITGSLILAGEAMRVLSSELHFDLYEDFDEPHFIIHSEGE